MSAISRVTGHHVGVADRLDLLQSSLPSVLVEDREQVVEGLHHLFRGETAAKSTTSGTLSLSTGQRFRVDQGSEQERCASEPCDDQERPALVAGGPGGGQRHRKRHGGADVWVVEQVVDLHDARAAAPNSSRRCRPVRCGAISKKGAAGT
jgi:hypothetical protein